MKWYYRGYGEGEFPEKEVYLSKYKNHTLKATIYPLNPVYYVLQVEIKDETRTTIFFNEKQFFGQKAYSELENMISFKQVEMIMYIDGVI